MKLKLLIGIITITLTTLSCSKEELTYSCDKEINSWVKQNIDKVQIMTRAELLNLPTEGYQRAAFSAFSPKQKIDVWETKIKETLTLDWSNDEKKHIEKLLTLIRNNTNWFETTSLDQKSKINDIENDITLKIYEWTEYANEYLKWNDQQIYSILGTPAQMLDTKGSRFSIRKSQTKSIKTRSETDVECNCSEESLQWSCHYLDSNCSARICLPVQSCGAFWLYLCIGICTPRTGN